MSTVRDCMLAALIAALIVAALGGIYLARVPTSPMLPGVTVCDQKQVIHC